jgi:arylsulfatase A-like enzyme
MSHLLPHRKTACQTGWAAALGVACTAGLLAEPARPNIIFIMTDDHSVKAVSAYDGALNETPHMDRLAREGMLFQRAFVGNAICGPSRAAMLTGKHSHKNGMIGNIGAETAFDGSQQTFPKLMQEAGYQTALIGKWHLRSDPTGFDHWEVLIGQGPYYNPPMLTPTGRNVHPGYTTDVVTDLSLEWLENQRDKEKPFVLLKHHKAPHRTWMPGPDHLGLYADRHIPEPPTLFDTYHGRSRASTMQEMEIDRHMHFYYDLKLPPREGVELVPNDSVAQAVRLYETGLTADQKEAWETAYGPENGAFYGALEQGMSPTDVVRWKYQRYIKDYLRTIASVDDNIGRLLDYLDESGLAENTLVIYTSDQGFFLGERGWYDKRFSYDESLQMPLIVRWPGVTKPGSRNRQLVQNIDFAPTFLEVAGVPVPEDIQGRSLVPLLQAEGAQVEWRDALYFHYYEYPAVHSVARHYGVRTDRFKLIHYYELGEWELFDLERDPHELTSAHGDPFYRETVQELNRILEELQAKYEDRHSADIPFEDLREMSVESISEVSRDGRRASTP